MNNVLMRAILFIAPFLFLFSCSTRTGTEEKRPPNILFIAADDLKPMLGCYGDEKIHSPRIDELAAGGTVFMNNHCQVALCGPSRASLLTGKYPDHTRIWGFDMIRDANPDIITLPQYFKERGYTTVNISKIFDYRTVDRYMDSISWSWRYFPMGDGDMEKWYPEETGGVTCYFYHSEKVKKEWEIRSEEARQKGLAPIPYTHSFIKPATECLDLPDHAYKDGVFALKAMSDLQRLAEEGKPFFLAVGFERPHLPWTAPKKYWDMYDPDSIKTAPFKELAQHDRAYFYTTSNELRTYTDEAGNDLYGPLKDRVLLSEAAQRKLIHGYMAAVTYIDTQIGMILDKLEESGEAERTIVVLWGDHGWHLGDHGIWGKSTNFEQATRSPLIIRVPGMKACVVNSPTEFIDIFPTLCELAGLEVPSDLDGQSLLKVMNGNEDPENRYAFSQFTRGEKMGYAIRGDRYRYVEWVETGRHVDPDAAYDRVTDRQLFDYRYDPLETINIAGEDSARQVVLQMAKSLRQWQEGLVMQTD